MGYESLSKNTEGICSVLVISLEKWKRGDQTLNSYKGNDQKAAQYHHTVTGELKRKAAESEGLEKGTLSRKICKLS